MNKLKKVGLSALAGTLATLSAAEAGSVSVNGTAELSWVNLPEHKVTGQQLGQKKNISFSGAGEFSNGWTYGIFHSLTDTYGGQSSSSMNINMGGILSIAYDSGTGGYGANAVDNVVPTAWEEIDYGFSTGITDVGAVSKAKGVVNLALKIPGSGTQLAFSYASRMGAGAVGDGGTSGDATANGDAGIDLVLDLWNVSTPHFGIRTGVAAEKINHKGNCSDLWGSSVGNAALNTCPGQKGDAYGATAYQTIAVGPLSAGFQMSYKDPGTAGGIENNKSFVWGVALTVGSYVSLSCGRGEDLYYYSDALDAGTHSGSDHDGGKPEDKRNTHFVGCSAAGNWGPLALKWTQNKVTNQGGTHNNHTGRHGDGTEKHSEINLSMAF